ncbi:hypothetical protein I8F94_04130 [Enterococcus gallinarum]|nr:hypothetical protein [Enterococcus gallinarum]
MFSYGISKVEYDTHDLFRRTGILEEKGESDGDKKVYFSQKMSLYSRINQAKQPLPFFKAIKKVEKHFGVLQKSNVPLKQYQKNIPSILLLIKVEKMLFLTTC